MVEELSGYNVTNSLIEDVDVANEIEDSIQELIDGFGSMLDNSKNKIIRKNAKEALEKLDDLYDNFNEIISILYEQIEKLGIEDFDLQESIIDDNGEDA